MLHLIAAIHVSAMDITGRVWHWLVLCVIVLLTVFLFLPKGLTTLISGDPAFIVVFFNLAGFFMLPLLQVFTAYLCEHFRSVAKLPLEQIRQITRKRYASLLITNSVLAGVFITGMVFAGFVGFGLTELVFRLFAENAKVDLRTVASIQQWMTVIAFVPVLYLAGRYLLVPFVVISQGEKVLESFERVNSLVKFHRAFVFWILIIVYLVVVADYWANQAAAGSVLSTISVNLLFGLMLMFYYVAAYILFEWLNKHGDERVQAKT